MKITTTLECGCVFWENGHRSFCPTCTARPQPPAPCEKCAVLKVKLTAARKVLVEVNDWFSCTEGNRPYAQPEWQHVQDVISSLQVYREAGVK